MRAALIALVVVSLAFGPAVAAAGGVLVLDHDLLTSMARTGSPGINIDYTVDRVVFRTRFRAAVIWLDVRLEAVFQRDGKRVHLVAQRLTAGGINQNGSRFDEAAARLAKLVDVETEADHVEIYRGGKVAYSQEVKP